MFKPLVFLKIKKNLTTVITTVIRHISVKLICYKMHFWLIRSPVNLQTVCRKFEGTTSGSPTAYRWEKMHNHQTTYTRLQHSQNFQQSWDVGWGRQSVKCVEEKKNYYACVEGRVCSMFNFIALLIVNVCKWVQSHYGVWKCVSHLVSQLYCKTLSCIIAYDILQGLGRGAVSRVCTHKQ